MNIEGQLREALLAELSRQAAEGKLTLRPHDGEPPSKVSINGDVNLDEVIMALAGALAGGP